MKSIQRTTQVVSVSLPPDTARKLESLRKLRGQSRSSLITSIINKEAEDERWARMFKKGREVGRKLGITSEDDVDRILHATED